MSDEPPPLPLNTRGSQRKNVPIVTVESFFEAHAEKLQLKLEGPRVGFHRLLITIALCFDLSIEISAQQCISFDFKPSLDGINEPGQLALSFRVHV